MKKLLIFICFLSLISCNKDEMEVTPEYSFVRLNDDDEISPCYTQQIDCLPINELADLKFQIVTDFNAGDIADFYNIVFAFPCDVCNDYNSLTVQDLIFGNSQEVDAQGDNGGNLQLTMVGHFSPVPQIGDRIFLTATSHYYGFHEILSINTGGAGDVIVLDLPFTVSGTAYQASLISTPMYLVTESTQIEDDSEFTGENYIWNFSDYAGDLSGYADGSCFRLCVWRMLLFQNDPNLPVFQEAECLGTTNCFSKISDICYTTKITYGCNENAFGFYAGLTAPSTVLPFEMSIRLPMWLYAPQYPGEEKGYQLSSGQFLKLSERVNKTWTLETDWKEEQFHERLRIALSCDNIEVSNENAQMTEVDIYRNAEYSIEWNDDVKNYPFAKGKTTVFKQLLSRSINSNCA